MSFAACLPIILASEGGYVCDPDDPGGATCLGVTIATLSAWEGHPATVQEVRALTPEAVAPIYEAHYWRAAGCDSAPAGADLMLFDMAVNQGVGRAIRSGQAALGLPQDGVIGPQTRAGLAACDPQSLVKAVSADRETRYRDLATDPQLAKFLNGWLNRLARTTALALQMAANAPADP